MRKKILGTLLLIAIISPYVSLVSIILYEFDNTPFMWYLVALTILGLLSFILFIFIPMDKKKTIVNSSRKNGKRRSCEKCIKYKTPYCPNSSVCYATEDKPYFVSGEE